MGLSIFGPNSRTIYPLLETVRRLTSRKAQAVGNPSPRNLQIAKQPHIFRSRRVDALLLLPLRDGCIFAPSLYEHGFFYSTGSIFFWSFMFVWLFVLFSDGSIALRRWLKITFVLLKFAMWKNNLETWTEGSFSRSISGFLVYLFFLLVYPDESALFGNPCEDLWC